MRFLTNYTKSCDLRSIMRNRNIAEYQKPCFWHICKLWGSRVITGLLIFHAVEDPLNSGISAKSREIPQKNAKYCEIRRKYFQIHVGKTYLILILDIRPVLFIPNVQIYLETSSLQRVNNVPKLPGVFR